MNLRPLISTLAFNDRGWPSMFENANVQIFWSPSNVAYVERLTPNLKW